MTLTVKEKEHWKDRISSRIDRAIEDIYRREGAQKRNEIRKASRRRVLDTFEIREGVNHIQSLDEKINKLNNEKEAHVSEVTDQLQKLGFKFGYGVDAYRDLNAFLVSQAESYEREVMLCTEFGRKIIRLKDEQDQLLDTVWLATSPNQIKRLWTEMASLLGEQPTELQQQALMTDSDSSTE